MLSALQSSKANKTTSSRQRKEPTREMITYKLALIVLAYIATHLSFKGLEKLVVSRIPTDKKGGTVKQLDSQYKEQFNQMKSIAYGVLTTGSSALILTELFVR